MQLKLTLNLDSKQYTAALQHAGQQVQQFTGQLEGGMARASGGADRLADAISKVGHYGAGLFALNKVGDLARGFIATADAATTLNNTLRLATGSAQSAGQAYEALFDIAQRSRVSFTELGSTFASLNRAGQEMGVSQQRMLAVTEAVGNAMTISGGSAQSMQAALVQLGQGMASGVLRGEELNSVMEQAPRLARALADGMGVPLGKLRELGSEGKITAEQVVAALESQAAVLRGEVTSATMTASQAFTQLQNATTMAIGELDKATGASDAVARAISGTAQAITAAGKAFKDSEGAISATLGALGGAATVAGVLRVASVITGAGGAVAAITAVRTAVLALSATMAANPVTLALLGLGALAGVAMAANRPPSSMEGMAREIEHTSERIAKAERQLAAAGGPGKGELTRQLEERIAAMRKYRAEMQQSLGGQEAAGIDTRAEDERNARRSAQLKAQAKDAEDLQKLRDRLSGVPDSYRAQMDEIIRLNQAGVLVGKEYTDALAAQQAALLKKGGAAGSSSAADRAADQAARALAATYATLNGTTADYAATLATYQRQRAAGTITEAQYVQAVERLIQKQPFAVAQAKEAADAAREQAKAFDDATDALLAEIGARQQSAAQAQGAVQKARDDAAAHALAARSHISVAEAVERVGIKRLEELRIKRQADGASALELKALDDEIAARKELAGLIGERDREAEAQREAQAAQAEWQKAADEINRSLTDALMRGFESGKGFAKNLRDTVVNMFKTMVLRPTVQMIVQGGMNAVGLGGGGQGVSGGGNLLGTASNLSSLYNAAGTVGSWLGLGASATGLGMTAASAGAGAIGAGIGTSLGLGSTAAAGTGLGLSMGGAGLGMTAGSAGASAIGAGLGTSAAAGGAGAAASAGTLSSTLAAIPGWGWALAGVALLAGSGVFNSRGANHTGGVYSSAGLGWNDAAGLLMGDDKGDALGDFTRRGNAELGDSVGQAVTGLLGVYQQLADVTGGGRDIDVVAGFATNGKYGDEDRYGYYKILDKVSGEVLADYRNRALGKDDAAAWQKYVADLGTGIVQQLRGTDIPKWIDDLLAELGQAPSLENLAAAVQEIGAAQQALAQFGLAMPAFAAQADAALSALMDAAGGRQALVAQLGSFYANYYSEAERAAVATTMVTAELGKLGYAMPASRDEYRAWVTTAIDAGEAGAQSAAGLLRLESAVAQLLPTADDAAAAMADARKAATDAAWEAAQKSIQAARDAAQAEVTLRQARLASAQAVVDLARGQARDLRGLVDSTVATTAAQAHAYIDSALAGALGGQLPDAAGLRQAITDARAGMGTSAYSNRLDYEEAQLILANKLDAIGDSGAAQVDVNQLLLEQAKAEVDRLDMLVKTGRAALDEARGTTGAVQGVAAAMQAFYDKLFEETGKDTAPVKTGGSAFAIGGSGSGGGDGGGGGGGSYDRTADIKAQIDRQLQLGAAQGLGHDSASVLASINAALYGQGVSNADIAKAYGLSTEDVDGLFAGIGIPRFAAGGLHAGGLRLVGERGPELELTGPSRIFNASQTRDLLQGGNTAELARLLQELITQSYAIGRRQVELMQSMETLARRQDAIGIKQREPVV